jgi:hypothetical protein
MKRSPLTQNLRIGVGTAQANLSCYGFHVWAEDFLIAAKAYAHAARKGSFVGHFLSCQSLELSLKAFLSLKGLSRRTLAQKPLGHNLNRLVDEAVRQNLAQFVQITPADRLVIQIANSWYDTPGGKRLQYFDVADAVTAFKGAPDYAALEELASRMQSQALRKAVLEA